MINYKTQSVEQKFQESITCNVCKSTYNCEKDWEDVQEFHHVRFRGGYGSVFGDGVAFRADICQHCLKELLGEYITEDDNAIL